MRFWDYIARAFDEGVDTLLARATWMMGYAGKSHYSNYQQLLQGMACRWREGIGRSHFLAALLGDLDYTARAVGHRSRTLKEPRRRKGQITLG